MEAFLRTGQFGPIALGMSRADLLGCLGPPEDWSVHRRRKGPERAAIWRYGSFEFHFDSSGTVALIYADDFGTLIGSSTLDLDPWIVRGRMRRDDLESGLKQAGISFRVTEAPDPTTCEQLTLVSGVTLLFVKEEYAGDPHEPAYGLYAVSRPNRVPDCR